MIKTPNLEKCQVECLFEYRYDGIVFHSLEFIQELDLLCLGTNKGKIYTYDIKIAKVEGASIDMNHFKLTTNKPNTGILNDKDLAPHDGSLIYERLFY